MIGDNLGPGLHPHTFRITSTNIGGGMFSNLTAASVPTTESDPPPIPIIKNKDTKQKKKENTQKRQGHNIHPSTQIHSSNATTR